MNAQQVKWASQYNWFEKATKYNDGTYSVECFGCEEAFVTFEELVLWSNGR